MSTVKAVNFQHPSASAANIVLASDGTVTGGIPSPNRNLLYNGAMQVAQRGTSTASISATGGYFTADRWTVEGSNLGTWTQSIESDAPTGSGFRKSLKMLCTTADAAPAAGDLLAISQQLEGQDLQRIAKGTASAQQLTVSFWVKSNVTGTYIAYLYDNDNTRHVSASYAISASATWERKTITFPADTTGAFDNDNASSLYCLFHLGAGSNFTSGTLATSWASYTAANRAVGQTNLAAATNNYWQVTGVQLEVGPIASPFDFKPYGDELLECRRYYFRYANGAAYTTYGAGAWSSATAADFHVSHMPMRAVPTSIEYANLGALRSGTGVYAISTSLAITAGGTDGTYLSSLGANSGASATNAALLLNNNNAAGYLALSAEL